MTDKKNSNHSFDFVNQLPKEKKIEFFKNFDWSSKISVYDFETMIEKWNPDTIRNRDRCYLNSMNLFAFDFFLNVLSEKSVLDMFQALNEKVDEKVDEWKVRSKNKIEKFSDVSSGYVEIIPQDTKSNRGIYSFADFFDSIEPFKFSYDTVKVYFDFSKKINNKGFIPRSEKIHRNTNMFNLMVHSKTHEERMKIIKDEILKDFSPFIVKQKSEQQIENIIAFFYALSFSRGRMDSSINFSSYDGFNLEIIDCFEEILKSSKTKDNKKLERGKEHINEMKFFSIYFMNPSLEKEHYKNKAIEFLNNLSDVEILRYFEKISDCSSNYFEVKEKTERINSNNNYFEIKKVLEERVCALIEKSVEISLKNHFFNEDDKTDFLKIFEGKKSGDMLKQHDYVSLLSIFEQKYNYTTTGKNFPWFNKNELTKRVFSKIQEILDSDSQLFKSKDQWEEKMKFLLSISNVSKFILVKDDKIKEEFNSRSNYFLKSCIKEIVKTAGKSWERAYIEVKKDLNNQSFFKDFGLSLLCSILLNHKCLSKTSTSKIDDDFFSTIAWGSVNAGSLLGYFEAKSLEQKLAEKEELTLNHNKKSKNGNKSYRF